MSVRSLQTLLACLSFMVSLLMGNSPSKAFRLKGQVDRIDRPSGRLQVKIPANSQQNTVGQYRIYDSKGKPLADFTILNQRIENQQVIIEGIAHRTSGRITVGMELQLELAEAPISILPDRFKEETTPPPIINYEDGSEGVLIPQGKLLFGTQMVGTLHYTSPPQMKRNEYQTMTGRRAVHYIDLPSFYMDRYEISRRQFLKFLAATGSALPPTWHDEGNLDLPADLVSYRQAEAYCRWAGRRLPTELEWEKAARGSGLAGYINEKEEFLFREVPQSYPTGTIFDPQRCVTADTYDGVFPIKAMTDESPYGIFGMCGNAPEWTSSWLAPYRGNTLNHPWFGRKYKVIRGGGVRLPKKFARAYERMAGGIPSLEEDYRAGFRCARNAN